MNLFISFISGLTLNTDNANKQEHENLSVRFDHVDKWTKSSSSSFEEQKSTQYSSSVKENSSNEDLIFNSIDLKSTVIIIGNNCDILDNAGQILQRTFGNNKVKPETSVEILPSRYDVKYFYTTKLCIIYI